MDNEREIRLSVDDIEKFLKDAKLIKRNEAVHRGWIEPGELVIEVVK
jgi:hypothetical protein